MRDNAKQTIFFAFIFFEKEKNKMLKMDFWLIFFFTHFLQYD